jgi:hypothetical protein
VVGCFSLSISLFGLAGLARRLPSDIAAGVGTMAPESLALAERAELTTAEAAAGTFPVRPGLPGAAESMVASACGSARTTGCLAGAVPGKAAGTIGVRVW